MISKIVALSMIALLAGCFSNPSQECIHTVDNHTSETGPSISCDGVCKVSLKTDEKGHEECTVVSKNP